MFEAAHLKYKEIKKSLIPKPLLLLLTRYSPAIIFQYFNTFDTTTIINIPQQNPTQMKTILSTIILLLLVAAAPAQSLLAPNTVEVGGEVAYTSSTTKTDYSGYDNESITSNIFMFNPYIGWMIGGGAEMGIKLSLSTGTDDLTSFAGYLAPAYNFRTGSIVIPYVEGVVGYATESLSGHSAKGMGYGGSAGMKVEIGSKSLILMRIEYIHQEYTYTFNTNYYYYGPSSSSPMEINIDQDRINFGVGFRMFFGGKAPLKAK